MKLIADIDPTRAKIMIVDDEPLNIKTVRKYLREIGYERFVTTTEPLRALEIIRGEHPDLVLLDVVMPELNGLELLRQIRRHNNLRYLPVIILTAYSDPETKREALHSGATDFLAKPIDPNELAPRLQNVLGVKLYQDKLVRYARQLEREVRERAEELLTARHEAEKRFFSRQG